MLIWGSKYLILMQGMCMVEAILKVHVCFLKHYRLIASYVIFSPHNDDIFEVMGVHINEVQNNTVLPHNYAHETVNFNLSHLLSLLLPNEIM